MADFPANLVGNAMRKIWQVSEAYTAERACLEPSIEEFICPITLEPLHTVTVGMTIDGQIFEYAAIRTWLSQHDTNPCTGQDIPSKLVLNLTRQKEYFEQFLRAKRAEPSVDKKDDIWKECRKLQEMERRSANDLKSAQAKHEEVKKELQIAMDRGIRRWTHIYIASLQGRCIKALAVKRIQKMYRETRQRTLRCQRELVWSTLAFELLGQSKARIFASISEMRNTKLDLKKRGKSLSNALVIACQTGEYELVGKLLERKARPDDSNTEKQALEVACDKCDFELLECLLSHCRPGVLNKFFKFGAGGTPIMRLVASYLELTSCEGDDVKRLQLSRFVRSHIETVPPNQNLERTGHFKFHKTWFAGKYGLEMEDPFITLTDPDLTAAFLAMGWQEGLVHICELAGGLVPGVKGPGTCAHISCKWSKWSVCGSFPSYLTISILAGEYANNLDEWWRICTPLTDCPRRFTFIDVMEGGPGDRCWRLEGGSASIWHYSFLILIIMGPRITHIQGLHERVIQGMRASFEKLGVLAPGSVDGHFNLVMCQCLKHPKANLLKLKLIGVDFRTLTLLTYGDATTTDDLLGSLREVIPEKRDLEAPNYCYLHLSSSSEEISVGPLSLLESLEWFRKQSVFPLGDPGPFDRARASEWSSMLPRPNLSESHLKEPGFKILERTGEIFYSLHLPKGCPVSVMRFCLCSHVWMPMESVSPSEYVGGVPMPPNYEVFVCTSRDMNDFPVSNEQRKLGEGRRKMLFKLVEVCPVSLLFTAQNPVPQTRFIIMRFLKDLVENREMVFHKPKISSVYFLESFDEKDSDKAKFYSTRGQLTTGLDQTNFLDKNTVVGQKEFESPNFELSILDLCLMFCNCHPHWDFLMSELKAMPAEALQRCGVSVRNKKGKRNIAEAIIDVKLRVKDLLSQIEFKETRQSL